VAKLGKYLTLWVVIVAITVSCRGGGRRRSSFSSSSSSSSNISRQDVCCEIMKMANFVSFDYRYYQWW
jgi:hypothetical protein